MTVTTATRVGVDARAVTRARRCARGERARGWRRARAGASDGAMDAEAMMTALAEARATNEALRAALEAARRARGGDGSSSRGSGTADAREGGGSRAAAAAARATRGRMRRNARDVRWPTRGTAFWEETFAPVVVDDGEGALTRRRAERPLRVVHVTAELAPVAKVGGLGDVVEGLARAHGRVGHDVTVVLPFYSCLPLGKIENLTHALDFDVPKGRFYDGQTVYEPFRTTAMRGRVNGIDVVLLKPHDDMNSNIFKGAKIYGGSYDEREAYLYFSRAAREYLIATGENPDVVHCHEWQTCAFALLFWGLREMWGQDCDGMWKTKLMLTIHNLDSNGEARQEEFIATGMDVAPFATIDRALDDRTVGHNPERLSLLKGGIVYANHVTTVSPTYAQEILDGGSYMSKILQQHSHKFSGILNGIDDSWDPSVDPYLPVNYDASDFANKAVCKKYVQRGLGLKEDKNACLVVCISRLVPQKGVHLIERAIRTTRESGGQFILLGTGHSDGVFRAMAETEEFGEKSDSVRLMLMYSDALSHLLYAAADIVTVPSMFEPCGLTQLIALKYGALPLVRRTGGLADTVFDIDDKSIEEGKRNGFTFNGTGVEDIDAALARAFSCYKKNRKEFEKYQRKGMQIDNGWNERADEYIRLYESLLQ